MFPWVLKSISLESNSFDLGISEACSDHLGKIGQRRTTVLVAGI